MADRLTYLSISTECQLKETLSSFYLISLHRDNAKIQLRTCHSLTLLHLNIDVQSLTERRLGVFCVSLAKKKCSQTGA